VSSRASFDVGPLSWVKSEIDQSLRNAGQTLVDFAASGAIDIDAFKSAISLLHQAHGALEIIGIAGLTRVSEELEALLNDIGRGKVACDDPVLDLAQRSMAALMRYLDELMAGEPNQPLRLLPVYHEIVAARSIEGAAEADPVDLYFPDLSARPPRREKIPVALHPEETQKYFREQRARFQRGFVAWLKGEAPGAVDMLEAVRAVELTQGPTAQRPFWWAAQAFFEALGAGALPPSIDARRTVMRVETQIRRLVEGSFNVADRLMREVLYGIALAQPATSAIVEAQNTFQLAGSVPGGGREAASGGEVLPLRDLLEELKRAWNRHAESAERSPADATALVALSERLARALAETQPELAPLAGDVQAVAQWLAADAARMSEAVALEVSTALLLLERALERPAGGQGLGEEFREQRERVSARLAAVRDGTLLRTAPGIPLLDLLAQRAQERLVTRQVVTDMQAKLRLVEQVLDAFFRDPGKRGELAGLGQPLQQLLASLDMLGETRARDALAMCVAGIERYAAPDYSPLPGDFEATAQALSGLGFYFEALAAGHADFDLAMRPLHAQAGHSVEAELGQQMGRARGLLRQWQRRPGDTLLKDELKKELNAIRQDAGLVADAALEARSQAALAALQDDAQPQAPQVAEAVKALAPAPAAQAPSAEVARLAEASQEAVDAELLAIFLEEADEVLAQIAQALAALRSEADDKEALTELRRGFHTLKGSGRMVGLTGPSEVAWVVEQALSEALETGRAQPRVIELAEAGRQYFTDNMASLKSGRGTGDPAQFMALAARAVGGEGGGDAGEPPADGSQARSAQVIDFAALAASASAAAYRQAAVELFADAPGLPDSIDLAGQRVSTTSFTLFSGEAHAHLAALRAEHTTLVNHGMVTDDMLRAAHELALAAATIDLAALRDLVGAFEQALTQLANDSLSEDEMALVDEALDSIDGMVTAAVSLRAPRPAPELIVRLENAAVPRLLAQSPDQVLVPEDEGAWPRELTARGGEGALDEAAPNETLPAPHVTPVERPDARVPDEIDGQLLPAFLEEAEELMPSIGAALRAWREEAEGAAGAASNAAPESIDLRRQALLRLLHTFKGSARMAGAMSLGDIAHHMETRAESASRGEAAPELLDELEASWDRASTLYGNLRDGAGATAPESAPGHAPADAPGGDAARFNNDVARAVLVREGEQVQFMLRVRADMVDKLVAEAGEVSIARSRIENEVRALKATIGELTDNVARLRAQLREVEIQAETQMQAVARVRDAEGGKEGFDPLEFDRFTRSQELTRLMAESVNDVQTVHHNLLQGMHGVDTALATQARLSRDLQNDLLRVRMVAVGSLAERLHRIVRVTARELDKRASLDIAGAAVELDRAVLDSVTPAIEHLLRNAVMHGIEAPAARVAAGKDARGEIRLELAQEGNEIRIALSDDGAGLDLERIRARAEQKGLLTPGSDVSEAELADYIFLPGFSTAGEVTQIAGRGMGMDVARNVVAGLGGRVEIATRRGQGMHTTIYLPLTLAVTSSLLAKAGRRLFAIPSAMVEHLMHCGADEARVLRAAGVAEWQGRRYPLASLSELVGAQPEAKAPAASGAGAETAPATTPVLLVKSGNRSLALEAEHLVSGNQEIVVKATGPHLQRVPGVTGATVLGSGEIVLIINPVQLAEHARRVAAREAARTTAPPAPPRQALVMVVDDSLTVRKITSRLLERQGYAVVVARDGVEALEQLRALSSEKRELPSVMLVDIEMPRMDGFELTRQVRADARLAALPLVMISSRTADKHRQVAEGLGVSAFLGKPYQEEDLLALVRQFMQAKAPLAVGETAS
jgi:chemosensory pili system protein ChpA (sensor histidine kinase/response regulator)